MGTPDLTVSEALRLFSRVGLGGAEIIWQDGYKSGLPEGDLAAADRTAALAGQLGLSLVCLTPYMTGLNSLNSSERSSHKSRFRKCSETASQMGVPSIRVYAGSHNDAKPSENAAYQERRRHLVASLKELGDVAGERGVTLCIENHFGTMAVSAAETTQLIQDVCHPHVRILYDQANLTFTHCESPDDALRLQLPWIAHVHVKDLVFVDPDRRFVATEVAKVRADERAVRSRVIGDGILDWAHILTGLAVGGYGGALSFEYEARWHPDDLPTAEQGLLKSVQRVRQILEAIPPDSARPSNVQRGDGSERLMAP